MATGYGAICSDFYINQTLALKMDLPGDRETLLGMLDRVRRQCPAMAHLRRFDDELVLESDDRDVQYAWLALRRNAVRSGWVNPDSFTDAYRLHRLILETSPFFLSISALDVEYLELRFGFDLEARCNRNDLVFDALLESSPLARLIDRDTERLLDTQPVIGFMLDPSGDIEAFIEVKARTRPLEVTSGEFDDEPVSVLLSVRHMNPVRSIDQFDEVFADLSNRIERLAEERVVPHLVLPLREANHPRPG